MSAGRPSKLDRHQEFNIRLNRESGATLEECAYCADVSIPTVVRVLRKLRKKLGPEKIRVRPSARRGRPPACLNVINNQTDPSR
jgi:transposase